MRDTGQQLREAVTYLRPAARDDVLRALACARQYHEGQTRSSGDPYVTHPIATALTLTKYKVDRDTLIAALLHDAVEDKRVTFDGILEQFGSVVANLVDGVTKLSLQQYGGRRAERQVASLRKMLLTANDDLRVIVIKLADRLHNVETIGSLPREKQERIAGETLDIYGPFARLLGLWDVKTAFEEACFPIAYPEESALWRSAVVAARAAVEEERRTFVARVNAETTDDVEARLEQMTDFNLFQKLNRNLESLQETRNMDFVSVIVQSEDPVACYQAMGEIHTHYPVRFASFKDYVANPQPNGYRALHTTIFLSRDHEVRLHIQTARMHAFATDRDLAAWLTDAGNDMRRALGGLHAAHLDDKQYIADLRGTVLGGRISVFTTAGDVLTLPEGATGVDFAFALNPDFLARLSGIRIDGEAREATYKLRNGDTVDLVLANGRERGAPRSLWASKAKTLEARTSLRRSLRHRSRRTRRELGADLLRQECRKRRLPLWSLFQVKSLQRKLTEALGMESFDALLEKIGSGEIPVGTVVGAYRDCVSSPASWVVTLFKVLRLLPRTHVMNAEASLIGIEVYAVDRPGMIYDISRCAAERKLNIAKFAVFALPRGDALYKIRLEVRNFEEFSDFYDALILVPGVRTVLRKR